MSELTRRVLVLGDGTRAFLGVARSLGRVGLEVHVTWCPLDDPTLRSKYVRRFHALPAYRPGADDWIAAFNDLARNYAFDLVVPCTDATILPLQLHRAALIHPERICLLPDDIYETCANKEQTYALAQRLGVPTPAQLVVSTLDEARAAGDRFGYPLVLKPKTSSSPANPTRRAVRKVAKPEKLEAIAAPMLAEGAILAQQNFIGKGVGVELLCKDGRTLVAFQHERVHEPMHGGGSSYRKSVPVDPKLLAATERMMRELRYTGVSMTEYKQNPATGAWTLIEINARFWGALPLSLAAGMDFPRHLYEMWLKGREDFPREYKVNRFCRNLTLDLQWMVSNLRADRNDPTLMTAPLPRVAAEFANLLLLRERSDTFVWDDPAPAWADLAMFLEGRLFSLSKRIGLLRHAQRRRAAEGLRRAHAVAFVCYGNICRSPFARAAVARMRPDLAVSSFGYYQEEARRSPAEAVEAARRLDVDLSEHRSRILTQADVDRADAILIFDRRNFEALRARFEKLEGKVHYFGALDTTGPLEIADPYGSRPEEFVKCFERIRRIAEMWFGTGARGTA